MPKRDTISFAKRIRCVPSCGRSPIEVLHSFCRLAACTLSCGKRESDYAEEAKRWTSEQLAYFSETFAQLIYEMELQPFTDLIGPVYMELGATSTKQARGEFYTPPAIARLTARMTLGILPKSEDPLTVMEPACGTGSMSLAIGETFKEQGALHRLRLTAVDISPLACDATFINTTLWSIPCVVVHGNTLSMEQWATFPNFNWLRASNSRISCPQDSRMLAGLRALRDLIDLPEAA